MNCNEWDEDFGQRTGRHGRPDTMSKRSKRGKKPTTAKISQAVIDQIIEARGVKFRCPAEKAYKQLIRNEGGAFDPTIFFIVIADTGLTRDSQIRDAYGIEYAQTRLGLERDIAQTALTSYGSAAKMREVYSVFGADAFTEEGKIALCEARRLQREFSLEERAAYAGARYAGVEFVRKFGDSFKEVCEHAQRISDAATEDVGENITLGDVLKTTSSSRIELLAAGIELFGAEEMFSKDPLKRRMVLAALGYANKQNPDADTYDQIGQIVEAGGIAEYVRKNNLLD